MKRLVYVFNGKNFKSKVVSYEQAQNIKAQTGLSYKTVYEDVKEENPNKGKYVGKTLAKYKPAYAE